MEIDNFTDLVKIYMLLKGSAGISVMIHLNWSGQIIVLTSIRKANSLMR